MGNEWVNPSFGSFDDVFSAALMLFELSTLEGWEQVMYAGVDAAADVDHTPTVDRNPYAALYFVVWVLLGGMVLVNMVVAAVVETYQRMQRKNGDSLKTSALTHLMTEPQQQWVSSFENALREKPRKIPPRPGDPVRAWCWQLLRSAFFEPAILGVILLNTAIMAADGYQIHPTTASVLSSLNLLCTVVFTLEAVLKVAAVTLAEYWADAWNRFDFLVVLISLTELGLGLTLEADQSGMQPTVMRALRMMRILRTMRAIKSSRGMRSLLATLVTSLPAITNVHTLFVLILLTYAVLGMHLFRHVNWKHDTHANFCSLWGAVLTMYRCTTGEGWNELMHIAMRPSADCDPQHLREGSCGSWVAIPFFISYVFFTAFV
jgi:voltage-dependent calcium channel T type alpha-1G